MEFIGRLKKCHSRNVLRRKQIYGDTQTKEGALNETIEVSLDIHASHWWQLNKDEQLRTSLKELSSTNIGELTSNPE